MQVHIRVILGGHPVALLSRFLNRSRKPEFFTCSDASALVFRNHHSSTPSRLRMAAPLSEKAKGKQRAVDVLDVGQDSSTTQPASRDLTIRFTEGGSDLIVHVVEKDTVKDVKYKVFCAPRRLCVRS
jgi:beta-lactamase superfamily II metal-dependent hydrolase